MSTFIDQVWLTQDAYDRLKSELAALIALREDTAEEVDVTEREQREVRIRQLQELITSAVVHEPPDDGVAEPGMVLTIQDGIQGATETFLIADQEEVATNGDLEVCTPRSPLGAALIGAVPGDKREYRAPDGTLVTVALIKAVPHRRDGRVACHAQQDRARRS